MIFQPENSDFNLKNSEFTLRPDKSGRHHGCFIADGTLEGG